MRDPEMVTVFLEEYSELLDIASKSTTSFSTGKGENQQKQYNKSVNDLFRVFHTVKGNSAYLDFRRLKKLSGAYCDFFRTVKESDGKHKVTPDQVELIQKCLRTMTKFKFSIKSGKKGGRIPVARLIKEIEIETKKWLVKEI
ncbi:MAG: Hpt domain-containing protein [Candidatus Odinarchaeota archaeon]